MSEPSPTNDKPNVPQKRDVIELDRAAEQASQETIDTICAKIIARAGGDPDRPRRYVDPVTDSTVVVRGGMATSESTGEYGIVAEVEIFEHSEMNSQTWVKKKYSFLQDGDYIKSNASTTIGGVAGAPLPSTTIEDTSLERGHALSMLNTVEARELMSILDRLERIKKVEK